MNKDTTIAELFFRFRYAKRLLEIDHPACDVLDCDQPSVGCSQSQWYGVKSIVIGLCEVHWLTVADKPASVWRVRWDEMEDAEMLH